MGRILVVDDILDVADNLVRSLERVGYDAIPAYSEKEAIKLLQQNVFDVVVTDMYMEDPESGLKVLEAAKNLDPDVEVIIMTSYGEVKTAVPAMKLGAFDYIEKDAEYYGKDVYDVIIDLVNSCIDSRQAEAKYQVVSKSGSHLTYKREIDFLRSQKDNYEIFVDDEYCEVYISGNEVDVRDLPYRILVYLMENRGALRSPIRLYHDVWGDPDDWVLAETNPKALRDRVKTRISDMRNKLNLTNIRISYRNDRYGLSVPDGVDYCLIKEFMQENSDTKRHLKDLVS